VTKLVHRKRLLVLETPYAIRGRALVVQVEGYGLKLREKGRRDHLEITWAQVHNRAAEIAAERARQERQRTRKSRNATSR
jgi:hypothetical protein